MDFRPNKRHGNRMEIARILHEPMDFSQHVGEKALP